MFLKSLALCRFNRHSPLRSAVKWDGLNFTGTCEHCGHLIRRKARRVWHADWLKDDEAADEAAIWCATETSANP